MLDNQNGKLRRIINVLMEGYDKLPAMERGKTMRHVLDCMIAEIESRLPVIPPGALKTCATCGNRMEEGDELLCGRAFDYVTGKNLPCAKARDGEGVYWYAEDATPCNPRGQHWAPKLEL